MKFLHKLLVFALLFVGVITQASAEAFTVNGVVYRITNTGVAVNNLAADNNLNGIVYVPEEVQYGTALKYVSLPNSLQNIGRLAFSYCISIV